MSEKIKIAVIGTGAAGFGVLTELTKNPDFEISVFDIFDKNDFRFKKELKGDEVVRFYDEIYKELKKTTSFKFPPPKTHFTKPLAKYDLDGKPGIFRSSSLGGLTNYWGGTALPFTDNELSSWNLTRKVLNPYYKEISEKIGISAKNDKLDEYFGENFATNPPFFLTKIFEKLDSSVNSSSSEGQFRVVSGTNRVTLQTQENHKNTCVYCGECLAGCFKDSIFSTRPAVENFLKLPNVKKIAGKVTRVETSKVFVKSDKQTETFSGFSKIFLGAGCPNSTEIVLRSTGLKKSEAMQDNAVYVFPIFYFGKLGYSPVSEPYLSLCNLIFGFVPKTENFKYSQAQIYSNFDYMWRYNIPEGIWKKIQSLVSYSRARLFWGRLYVCGAESQSYECELFDDKIKFSVSSKNPKSSIAELMKSVRRTVNKNGFYVPPVKPLLQKTNSHYASTFPYKGEILDVSENAEFMKDVFLCDSSVFPDLPAVSLTFTIMANACRITTEAIN